jgi:hypothetical protein
MQVTDTGTVADDNTITLPSDCRAVQSVRVNVGGPYQELHPLPPERLADVPLTTAYPVGYVTVGRVLQVVGGSGAIDYALTYFQQVPALADSDVNWLVLREPGLYLYATLLEASPYIKDADSAQVWAAQYQALLDAITAEDSRARYGNAPAIGSPIRNAP